MRRGRRMFLFGLVAVATVPVVYVLTRPPSGVPLTAERLAEAKRLWERQGPRSYDLDIEVPDARHRVEVRDRAVVRMTTNGADVPERVREKWSVEGMLVFLSEELSNLQRVEAAYGVSDPAEVTLRAAFDARTGFPTRFLRHVQGRTKSFEWTARLSPR